MSKSESDPVPRSWTRIWPVAFSTYQIRFPGPKVNAVGTFRLPTTSLARMAGAPRAGAAGDQTSAADSAATPATRIHARTFVRPLIVLLL